MHNNFCMIMKDANTLCSSHKHTAECGNAYMFYIQAHESSDLLTVWDKNDVCGVKFMCTLLDHNILRNFDV